MRKTSAERQADFKARMYAKGFKQKQTWVDEDGFTVGPEDIGNRKRPRVPYADFLEELKKLVKPAGAARQEEIYAELLVCARRLRERRDARRESK